ncbi:hypothetical protein KC333_g98 [Hortaea werneckii]|nr:hypothetical protein KC333_g98 [Hortaea werneckii]
MLRSFSSVVLRSCALASPSAMSTSGLSRTRITGLVLLLPPSEEEDCEVRATAAWMRVSSSTGKQGCSSLQNFSLRIQLASTTAVSFVSPASSNPPTPPPPAAAAVPRVTFVPSGAKSAPTNRVVSQLILHPSVPVSRICAVSGGRRR